MKPYLVVYATRDGHTFRIADHIADGLRERRIEVCTRNAASWLADNLRGYSGALLVSPVHAGIHAREMVRFVRSHCAELLELSARMLSVSLQQARVEPGLAVRQSHGERQLAEQKVRQYAAIFCAETGFPQSRIVPVAAALVYSRYGLAKRLVMQHIAARMGAGQDTTRDYDYTNWQQIDQLVAELAQDPRLTVRGLAEPFSFRHFDRPSSAPPVHRLR